MKEIHLWSPNIFNFKGGIQLFLDTFIKVMQQIAPNKNYHIFLKHDNRLYSKIPFYRNTKFHFYGQLFLPLRTFIFAVNILIYGFWKQPTLIIAGHVNFTPVAYWLKCIVGVPYWIIVYGVDAWNIERPALKTALANAEYILSISSYTRDRLLKEQNIDPAKISLLPCTLNADQFKVTSKPQYLLKRYGLTANQPIILTVARLDSSEKYKGYDKILLALPEIRNKILDVHYILVGKGSDRARIEQLITSLNLQDCVTLTGFVPDEELCDHYNLCDVFAMPSKGEGFGIVYLEALACGKPTIGGNQDGAIDALCQGELGVLVDPDNIEEITKTIIQILQGIYPHPLLYQPELLRQKVIKTYGFERFKETLAELLQTTELGVQ
ncbi:MAG: glycosyltransferase [Coleofasciculus sp. B1-GNL1-01]|uniref:glycosyltransferase n=1 Tax=Coleofasciculus sp. B1-GNL1-01 TaxID=3068484 RepID=UPI0032FD9BCD